MRQLDSPMSFNWILTEINEQVGIIRLNRPDKLNAICQEMILELVTATQAFDNNSKIGCIVITGNDKAFAAGADIEEMAMETAESMLLNNPFYNWTQLRKIKKPIIAAISGYCFGGGCELAMSCDILYASETAQFSQPEVNLGIIPGAGGTQRLVRQVGKSKAMEMILSGSRLCAEEALQCGLIAQIYPLENYFEKTIELAKTIAAKAHLAVQLSKEMINAAYETSLTTGLDLEQKTFYALFDSDDKREGMAAFLSKRPAQFRTQAQ